MSLSFTIFKEGEYWVAQDGYEEANFRDVSPVACCARCKHFGESSCGGWDKCSVVNVSFGASIDDPNENYTICDRYE